MQRHQRLAERMARRGDWLAGASWVRPAMDSLPRHDFAGETLWHWDGNAYVPVVRSEQGERWAEVVYAGPDDAAVTQLLDGQPSSSLSCPAVVAGMLGALDVQPGHRVLELGTGMGWNAALLARRAGGGRVTSVETDPALAAAAVRRLDAAGAGVAVEVGDGQEGWPAGALYDRLIATYAAQEIPWAWVEQTRPGGRIVAPWGHLGHVALTVADDGQSATGSIAGLAQFMPARGSAPPRRTFTDVCGNGPEQDQRTTARDLAPLAGDVALRFALRVALPELQILTAVDEDGHNAWLHDSSTSWAALSAQSDGPALVHQGGPRRLADELDRAWDQWLDLSRPRPGDYGLTVTSTGQYAWCHHPATGPRWPVTGHHPVAAPAC
jgi:protein-L-isoaspartate(D-aspartate) O-methyltransferase